MSDSVYFVIRQTLMGLLLYLGLHMLFISLPSKIRNSFYQRSLRLMGCAFLFVPLSCFFYTPNINNELEPYISATANLTAYFATFILMVLAFLTLLGKDFSKLIIRISVAVVIIFPIPLWITIISKKIVIIDTALTASYSYFVFIIILLVISVVRNCRKAINNIENYYSDDIQISISWINRSIWLLIGLSLTCAIAPLLSISSCSIKFIFLIYGTLCYLHIYYGYQRMLFTLIEYFMLQKHDISNFSSIEQENSQDTILSSAISDKISIQLTTWLSNKRYLQKDITISIIAKEINTNRTYLSKYINTTYNCSFKNWITQLRIEEAKFLLINKPYMTISSISDATGFASVESLTHIFTRLEKISPAKWRTQQKSIIPHKL